MFVKTQRIDSKDELMIFVKHKGSQLIIIGFVPQAQRISPKVRNRVVETKGSLRIIYVIVTHKGNVRILIYHQCHQPA